MHRRRCPAKALRLSVLLLAATLPVLARDMSAQVAAQARAVPAYDIVSIKPDRSGKEGTDITTNDDLFTANHISVRALLADAYTINPDLIYGIPSWAKSASFVIHAKMLDPDRDALHNLSREQWGALLQPMLAHRFHLKAHTETRTLPTYELVVAKDGPKFQPSVHHEGETGLGTHNAQLTAVDIQIGEFATELSRLLHRTVVDKSALSGKYDFKLTWQSPYAPHSSEEDSEASIFTALQEQLGLKLRPAKGPVVVLVVDQVEEPTPD